MSTPTDRLTGLPDNPGEAACDDTAKCRPSARKIDMRSDTVTKPTDEMRGAMAVAPVGNDDFGEDPTVNRLQDMAAELTGKEAALLVSSGTMANLIALRVLGKDQTTIVGENAHIYYNEGRAVRSVTQTRLYPVDDSSGLPINAIERALDDNHAALVALETPNARLCGRIVPPDAIRAVAELAHARGATVHLDGARLFNASTKLGLTPAELLTDVDTAAFCLTKALGAPYGSLLVGSAEFIDVARDARWLMGGGLKQVGIMAAAGIVALETMIDRIRKDHCNAALLYDLLSEIDGIELPSGPPETNMVFVTMANDRFDRTAVVARLAERGVLAHNSSTGVLRMVTHKDVTEDDVYIAARQLRKVLEILEHDRLEPSTR